MMQFYGTIEVSHHNIHNHSVPNVFANFDNVSLLAVQHKASPAPNTSRKLVRTTVVGAPVFQGELERSNVQRHPLCARDRVTSPTLVLAASAVMRTEL